MMYLVVKMIIRKGDTVSVNIINKEDGLYV